MSTNNDSRAFWAHPDPDEIAPGDVFPDIPFSISPYPTQLVRKYRQNLPPKHAQNLQQLFDVPSQVEAAVPASKLTNPGGDACVTTTRVSMGLFLTYGSELDSDLRHINSGGKVGAKAWLAAPVFPLNEIPDRVIEGTRTMRDVIIANESGHTFYLQKFPDDSPDHLGYYVEFRRICPVGVQFFLDRKGIRRATMMPGTKNAMYQQLMWFWTRFELFFHPLKCDVCGSDVKLDVRIEGQNIDVEPWQ